MMKRIVVLGSTGSIGENALRVVRNLGKSFRVVGLSAHRNADRLAAQIKEFQPEAVALLEEPAAAQIRRLGLKSHGRALPVFGGIDGLERLASWPSATTVLCAVVGGIGLRPLLAALKSKKHVALANKEALIMAGDLVVREARRAGVALLPVDSEHSAIFQCLRAENRGALKRIILTASGGPFYRRTESFQRISVQQALAHPTWKMGKKITVDSATLMNKGIEAIEAHLLFGIPMSRVDIVIHPQSIVHSLVELIDGAMLAQLSWPDMRLPIQYALTYPDRAPSACEPLDLVKAQKLEFYAPDFRRFPCLELALEAGRRGVTYPTVLNAANEVAVGAFLHERARFTDIPRAVETVLSRHQVRPAASVEAVLEIDAWAREEAAKCLS